MPRVSKDPILDFSSSLGRSIEVELSNGQSIIWKILIKGLSGKLIGSDQLNNLVLESATESSKGAYDIFYF